MVLLPGMAVMKEEEVKWAVLMTIMMKRTKEESESYAGEEAGEVDGAGEMDTGALEMDAGAGEMDAGAGEMDAGAGEMDRAGEVDVAGENWKETEMVMLEGEGGEGDLTNTEEEEPGGEELEQL